MVGNLLALLYLPAAVFSYSGPFSILLAIVTIASGASLSRFRFSKALVYAFIVSLPVYLLYGVVSDTLLLSPVGFISVAALMPMVVVRFGNSNYVSRAILVFALVFVVLAYDPPTMSFFGRFLDRNIVALAILPIVLWISRSSWLGIMAAISLAYWTNSRNLMLAVLVELLLRNSALISNIYSRNPFYVSLFVSTMSVAVFAVLGLYAAVIPFESGRGNYVQILDESNLQRSVAMIQAIEFLSKHPSVMLFGGGWQDYSLAVVTRAHSDYVQLTVKYGFIPVVYFLYLVSFSYRKAKVPASVFVSLLTFSGILGGIGWGAGVYWLSLCALIWNRSPGASPQRVSTIPSVQ